MQNGADAVLDSYATLVDHQGRFVWSIGRVVGTGDDLEVKETVKTAYNKRLLLEAVREAGLELKFIPPAVRLPSAPNRIRDQLFNRLASIARVEI
jgi:hypothetical protein